jgi:hypothetical protein
LEAAVTVSTVLKETPTVVLLGASNLSLGWRPLMQVIFARWWRPLRILTAHGMGRAYLTPSQFGWRTAPGILESDLWSQLAHGNQSSPDAALITDLGNDLVYGRTAAEVVQAAADAAGRLRNANPDCQIVMTRPPLASVASLSRLRYGFFRTVLFPMCRLSLSEIVEATRELDDGIQRLQGVTVVPPQAEWFGLDPIHVRRRLRKSAFTRILKCWSGDSTGERTTDPVPLARPKMATRWVMGRQQRCEQPSVFTARGSVSAW